MISRIKLAGVFVSDMDRAFDFYVNTLGFTVRTDQTFGDYRWLEVVPEGGETALAVAKPNPGNESAIGWFANIVLYSSDVEGTYRELSARGVTFTEPPAKQPWGGTLAQFVDPDGNVFVLADN